MQPSAPPAPPALTMPDEVGLRTGERWVFAFEREGGVPVEQQAVIAHVRPYLEVILYVGPRRYAIPWSEVPAAFAHATRGTVRRGLARPAAEPPPAPQVPAAPPPPPPPAVSVPAPAPEPPQVEAPASPAPAALPERPRRGRRG